MKEKIRIFVCDKCCNTAYTTDGSIPGACTSQYWVRTSGICGGHYTEVEGADFNWVVNQEVEKRIAERGVRFLSPVEGERRWQEYCLKLLYSEYPNMCKWQLMNLLIHIAAEAAKIEIPSFTEYARLTNPGVKSSQKTEGGGE